MIRKPDILTTCNSKKLQELLVTTNTMILLDDWITRLHDCLRNPLFERNDRKTNKGQY